MKSNDYTMFICMPYDEENSNDLYSNALRKKNPSQILDFVIEAAQILKDLHELGVAHL